MGRLEAPHLPSARPPPRPRRSSPRTAWLRFDSLQLRGPEEGEARGRLRHVEPASTTSRADLQEAQAQAQRLGATDPQASRGHYDHRYEASGRMQIPADGLLHRVEIQRATCWAKLWWRAVPLERDEVFRLARIPNPLEGPLLAGPLDVFVEGSFLLSTTVEHVDRGGEITVGLGVDERLQVARNVRVTEEHQGLLGGKTAVDHTVTLEVSSTLGFDAHVELLERVPVSIDDHIDVEELEHQPAPEPYDQLPDGPRLQGGRRFELELEPGGTAHATLHYRITLSSKSEIVGGNRRD